MSEEELRKIAEKRADEKIKFYRDLYGFIIANVFFFVLNIITGLDKLWFYWITIIWGIVLLCHFLKTFVFNENKLDDTRREKMIEKEIEKMKK